MLSRLKIRDLSGWTMAIFGALAFALGLIGILFPELILSLLGFPVIPRAERVAGDYTLVFVIASPKSRLRLAQTSQKANSKMDRALTPTASRKN